jgi:hypothetical protein
MTFFGHNPGSGSIKTIMKIAKLKNVFVVGAVRLSGFGLTGI